MGVFCYVEYVVYWYCGGVVWGWVRFGCCVVDWFGVDWCCVYVGRCGSRVVDYCIVIGGCIGCCLYWWIVF